MSSQNQIPQGVVYKSEICELYRIGSSTLAIVLNKTLIKDLEPLGYKKSSQYLTPLQFQKFVNRWGNHDLNLPKPSETSENTTENE